MLKKTIKYTDYYGNDLEEDFFFNINKAELIKLEGTSRVGYSELITQMVNAQDVPALLNVLSDIVKLSYGVVSDDGKSFIKDPKVTEEFIASEAYVELYVELMRDPDKSAAFIKGIFPTNLKLDKEKPEVEVKNTDKIVAQEIPETNE